MPLSLRIPPEKDRLIRIAADKAGKSKSAFIIEAIDEKLGIGKSKEKEKKIRDFAGWATREEVQELREALEVFNKIDEGDWE